MYNNESDEEERIGIVERDLPNLREIINTPTFGILCFNLILTC